MAKTIAEEQGISARNIRYAFQQALLQGSLALLLIELHSTQRAPPRTAGPTEKRECVPKEGEMTRTVEEKNKALVLEAFETLFNKKDYAAANASGRRPTFNIASTSRQAATVCSD